MKYPGIILGQNDTGLGICRSLYGHVPYLLCIDSKPGIVEKSKLVKSIICPDPIIDEGLFILFLKKLAESFKVKPIIFIAKDIFLSSIAKNIDTLNDFVNVNMPESLTTLKLLDKYEFYLLAKEHNFLVPETYMVQNSGDLEIACQKLKFPFFLKASNVVKWKLSHNDGLKGVVINDRNDIKKVNTIIGGGELNLVAQQIIEGADNNLYEACTYTTKSGEVICNFVVRKLLQYPTNYGIGSLVESVHFPFVQDFAKKVVQTLKVFGTANLEFKLCESDNKFYLIEINARYWTQNRLATKCGLNFPVIDYSYLSLNDEKKWIEYKKNVCWINIYYVLLSQVCASQKAILSWKNIISIIRKTKSFAIFDIGDMAPILYELLHELKVLKIFKYAVIIAYRKAMDLYG